MKEIAFVDTTLRDAHQSLWNGQMTTAMMLPIAPVIDDAGFEAADLLPLVFMDWLVRYLNENPWERMRKLSQSMPKTPLIIGGVLGGFGAISDSVTELWIQEVARAGMRRIRINEPYHDLHRIAKCIRWAKAAGMKTMVALIYSYSPVHTDEYYAKKALAIAKLDPDIIFIKDVDGLLTPERTQTLVPAIIRMIHGIPLEIHGHCTTGLAPLVYLEAIKLGVKTVHTATLPLANGSSQPSAENTLKNIRRLGYSARLNEKALEEIAAHFRNVAKREGFPIGSPVEYDLSQYDHQLPGGMVSNYRFELSKRGLEHRIEDLLEEIALVRQELGYPIMITPLSQYVGVQAILNISGAERYGTVTDEIIKYALSRYGKLAAPVDKNVLNRIMKLPRTRELLDWEPPQPNIQELRHQYGADLSNEELLLRIFSTHQKAVDKVLAAGPMNTQYPPPEKPTMILIRELLAHRNSDSIHIEKGEFSLTLSRWRNG